MKKLLQIFATVFLFASYAKAADSIPTFPTGMSVVLQDGTVLAVTQDTSVTQPTTWTDLAGDTTAAKYAERVARKVWAFPVVQPENGLQLSLRAVKLANALPEVEYTRYELSITNPETGADVAIDKVVMMDGVEMCGEISGNTDGSVFVNDTAFLAVEHPMAKMSAVVQTLDRTYSAEDVAASIANPATPWELPIEVAEAGDLVVTVDYTGGNHKSDIASVYLKGTSYIDTHNGSTGASDENNTYTLSDVQVGRYTLCVQFYNGDNRTSPDTHGNILLSGTAKVVDFTPRTYDSNTAKNSINNNTAWEFDVFVPQAGDLAVTFNFTSGSHRAYVKKVSVKNAAIEDEHEGYAGAPSLNNTYTLRNIPVGMQTICVYFKDGENNVASLNTNGNISFSGSAVTSNVSGYIPVSDTLVAGATMTYSFVEGEVEEASQFRRGFHAYLDMERAHPYRIFPHYNSWYDLCIDRNEETLINTGTDGMRVEGKRMNEAECLTALQAIRAAMTSRGVHLDSYLWDDGWDNWNVGPDKDSEATFWGFHDGFPNGFSKLAEEAQKDGASISTWLSPFGGYGVGYANRFSNAKANEIVSQDADGIHLSYPKVYRDFTDRCLYMIEKYDMNMFKFDRMGDGGDVTGASGNSKADMRAVVNMINELRAKKQDVFINATVGTWASPFWVMWADSIWRGGADWEALGPGANKREDWITYRDNKIYDRFVSVAPLFPMNSMMLHGIIVGKYGPPKAMAVDTTDATKTKSFANEVWMGMACGTGLQEYYIDQTLMSDEWWDILAEGVKWVKANEETLRDTHWIGNDPENNGNYGIYGYASLGTGKGIIILRNPSNVAQTISVNLADMLEAPVALRTANKPVRIKTVYTSDVGNTLGGTDFPAFATLAAEAQDLTLEPYGIRLVEILDTNTWSPAGEDTDWSNTANWTTGQVPTGGEVTLPAGATVTMDVDATVEVLKFDGAGTLTIAGTGTLTVKDFGAENRNNITINSGAHLVIDAPETYSPTAPLEITQTVTNNGTLSTYGNVKLSSGSNTTFGVLNVETGTLALNVTANRGGGNTGIRGELNVKAGATFKNLCTADALSHTGTSTINVWGVLDMAETRWTITANATINLYGGGEIKGVGQSAGNGIYYGALDWDGATAQIKVKANEDDPTQTKATISAGLRRRNTAKISIDVAEGLTLYLSGAKAPNDYTDKMGFALTGDGTVIFSGENKGTAGITVDSTAMTTEFLNYGAMGASGTIPSKGTMILHVVAGESAVLGPTRRNNLRDFEGSVILYGEGDVGLTSEWGELETSPLKPYICIESGHHIFKFGQGYSGGGVTGDWSSDGTVDQPNIWVKDGARLDFYGRDVGGYNGSASPDSIIRVNNGGILNLHQYGTSTFFYRNQFYLEPGATMTIAENNEVRLFGGIGTDENHTAQIYVPAVAADAEVKTATVSGGKIHMTGENTKGFAFEVGENAELVVTSTIESTESEAPVAKYGIGTLKLTTVNDYNGQTKVVAGLLKVTETGTLGTSTITGAGDVEIALSKDASVSNAFADGFTGTLKVTQGTYSVTGANRYPKNVTEVIVSGENATLATSGTGNTFLYEGEGKESLTIEDGATFAMGVREVMARPLVLNDGATITLASDLHDSGPILCLLADSSITVDRGTATIRGADSETSSTGIIGLRNTSGNNFAFTVNGSAVLDIYSKIGRGWGQGGSVSKEGTGTLVFYSAAYDTNGGDNHGPLAQDFMVNQGRLKLVDEGQPTSTSKKVVLAAGTVLEWYTEELQTILNGVTSSDATAVIEKRGIGTTVLDCDLSGFQGHLNVIEGILDVGTTRPTISDIGPRGTVRVTPTTAEMESGEITFTGLPVTFEGSLEVVGANGVKTDGNTVTFAVTPVWTYNAETPDATWDTATNWSGGTVPTTGNVIVRLGESGVTLALGNGSFDVVAVEGAGALTLAAGTTLTVKDFEIASTITGLNIATDAQLIIDAIDTYVAEAPLTIATTITNNGTLTTKGYVKLESESNASTGAIDVQTGCLAMNAGGQAIKGSLTIQPKAEFLNLRSSDAISYNEGGVTVDVYGTLNLAGTRWTMGADAKLRLYDGAVVKGQGDNTGALDFYAQTSAGCGLMLMEGAAEISATVNRKQSDEAVFTVAEGAELTFSGNVKGDSRYNFAGGGKAILSGTKSNAPMDIASGTTVEIANGVTFGTGTVTGAGTLIMTGLQTVNGLTDSTNWTGLFEFSVLANDNKLTDYGNVNSRIRFTGNSAIYFGRDTTTEDSTIGFDCPAEFILDGTITLNNGYSGRLYTFKKLSGTGTLATADKDITDTYQFKNVDNFTGTFTLSHNRCFVIGEGEFERITDTNNANNNNKKILILSGATATITKNMVWTAGNGMDVAGTLHVAPEAIATLPALSGSGEMVIDASAPVTIDATDALNKVRSFTGTVVLQGEHAITLAYPNADNAQFSPRIKIVSGHHIFKYGEGSGGEWATGDSDENPTILVMADAELDFYGRDLGTYSGTANGNAVVRVNEGGTLNLFKHSGTFYYHNRFVLDPGATMTIKDGEELRLQGGIGTLDAHTAQIYVPAVAEDATVKTAVISGGKIYLTKEGEENQEGFAIEVGENANLQIDSLIQSDGDTDAQNAPIAKYGAGTVTLTGANTYVGPTTIAEGMLALSGHGTLGTSAVTVAEGATLAFVDTTGSAAFNNALSGSGKIEKAGTGFVTFADTMSIGEDLSIDVTGGVLNLGTLRPTITSIAEGATVIVTPTETEIAAGKVTFAGLPETVAGTIDVEGFASPTVGANGEVTFETTPTWTVQAEGANTWNTQANWGDGKTIPTSGNVKIDIGESGATLTLDAAVELGAVEIIGIGKLTIVGSAEYPLAMTDLTVADTVTEIEIQKGAVVTIDVSATTSAEVEKEIATKMINNGTLTTGGYLKLSNGGNTTSKSLTVASGRLTMNTPANGGGFSGAITVNTDAEFNPTTGWSLSISAKTTIDIYGTLTLGGGWTVGSDVTFSFYTGATLRSTANDGLNGDNGTIYVKPLVTTANDTTLTTPGVVTLAGRVQGSATYMISDGMILRWDGATCPEGASFTMNTVEGSAGTGVVELYKNGGAADFPQFEGNALVKVTGNFQYGIGGQNNLIENPLEIVEGATLRFRAWEDSLSRELSYPTLTVNGEMKMGDGGNSTATLTIDAEKTLKGKGTIALATTFADDAILDAREGAPELTGTVTFSGKLSVKVSTEWETNPLILKGVTRLPAASEVIVGNAVDPTAELVLVATDAGLAVAQALPVKVGDQYFASIADAVAVAGATGTVTITGNCSVAELDVSNGVTLAFENNAVLTVTKLVVGENRDFMNGADTSHLVVAAGGSVGIIEGATEGSPIEVTWSWADASDVEIVIKPLNYDTESTYLTNGEDGKVALDAEGNITFPTSLHGKGAWYEYLFENGATSTGAQAKTLNPDGKTPDYQLVPGTKRYASLLKAATFYDDTIAYPTLEDPAVNPVGTPAWSASFFARMPSNAGGALISFGYTYDDDGGVIALVRGYANMEDQVLLVYAPYKETDAPYTVLAEMTVPNAETTYHLYTFVKWYNKVEVFLDETLWVTVAGDFDVDEKFQLGKICGGTGQGKTSRFTCKVDGVQELPLVDAADAEDDDTPAAMDMLRLYDCELTEAEVVRLAEEYTYDSPNENYTRTLMTETGALWVSDNAWTLDDNSKVSNPDHGLVTLKTKLDATITVNLATETTLERLTLTGASAVETGKITLAAGSDTQALKVTGLTDVRTDADIDCSTVRFAGAVNVAAGKTLTLTVPDAVIYGMVHESLRTGKASTQALTGLILGEGTVTHALTGEMSTEWTLTGGKNANNVYELTLQHNPWYVVQDGETVTWKSGTTLEDAAELDPTYFPNSPKNLAGAPVTIIGDGSITLPGGATPKLTVEGNVTLAVTTTVTPTTPVPGYADVTVPVTSVEEISVAEGCILTFAEKCRFRSRVSESSAGDFKLLLGATLTVPTTEPSIFNKITSGVFGYTPMTPQATDDGATEYKLRRKGFMLIVK